MDHKISIAYFSSNFPPDVSGVAKIGGVTCSKLIEDNHEIQIHTYPPTSDQYQDLVASNVFTRFQHIWPKPKSGSLKNPSVLWSLYKFYVNLKKQLKKCDVIHINSYSLLGLAASLCAKTLNVPLVVSLHGTEVWNFKGGQFSVFYKLINKWADAVDGDSIPLVDKAKQLFDRDDIAVIALPMTEGQPLSEGERDTLKKDAGYEGKFVFFSTKSLHAISGYGELLEGVSEVSESKDWVFIINGQGPLKEKLQQKVKELGLQDRVIFKNGLSEEELKAHYQFSDCYLLGSCVESGAGVLLESIAQGTPTISIDSPGAVALSENYFSRSVKLSPVGDARKLSENIERMIKHPFRCDDSDASVLRNIFSHTSFMMSTYEQYKKSRLKIEAGR